MNQKEMLFFDPKVTVYIPKAGRGKKYWINYRLPNKIRVRRPASNNESEAKRMAKQKENLLRSGNFDSYDNKKLKGVTEKLTIEDGLELYKKMTFLKKSSITVDRERYTIHSIFGYFKDEKGYGFMDQIKVEDVTDYIYYLKSIKRPVVTINNYLRIIRKVINRLHKLKRLENNLATEIELLPMTAKEGARHVIFTLEDIFKLVNVKIDENYWQFPTQSLFKFMLHTGIRLGEALHLSWKDIDLENMVVKIQEKNDCPTLLGMGWKPKWGKEYSPGLNEDAVDVLNKLPRIENAEARIRGDEKIYHYPFVFAKRTGIKSNCKKKCSNCESNIVKNRNRFSCGNYTFRFSRCDDISKSWRRLLKLAGIPEDKYHIEDTRRTFNTYAKSHAGFSDALAAFAIGNSQDVNIKHYTNQDVVNLAKIREVKEKINSLPFTEKNIGQYVK